LRGGTDLQKALEAGLGQFSGTDTTQTTALVLLTDGETTRGLIQTGKLADWYAAKWKQIPAERRPKTEVFAVGDDANLPLLRMLSRNGGVMEQVLSTEPVEFKLAAFLGKVGRAPISDQRRWTRFMRWRMRSSTAARGAGWASTPSRRRA
jgi:Ca-activated chloride channel family protein